MKTLLNSAIFVQILYLQLLNVKSFSKLNSINVHSQKLKEIIFPHQSLYKTFASNTNIEATPATVLSSHHYYPRNKYFTTHSAADVMGMFPPPPPPMLNHGNRNKFAEEKQSIINAYILPTTSLIKHTNPGGILSLLFSGGGTEADLDNALSESAVLDTLSDVLAVIGLHDVRDWLGIILMMFLLGPILISMILLPISMIILGAFSVPLILYSAPSRINATDKNQDEGRNIPVFIDKSLTEEINIMDQDGSNCFKMVSCETFSIIKNNPLTKFIIRLLEDSGSFIGRSLVTLYSSETDDINCTQYYCAWLYPIRTFFQLYYSSMFGEVEK